MTAFFHYRITFLVWVINEHSAIITPLFSKGMCNGKPNISRPFPTHFNYYRIQFTNIQLTLTNIRLESTSFVKNMKSWLLIWSSYMSTSCNLFSKLSFVIFVVLCRNRVSTLKRGRTTKKFPYNFCWQNFLLKEELLNISDVPFLRKNSR